MSVATDGKDGRVLNRSVLRNAGSDLVWGRELGYELKTGAGSENFNKERERDFVLLSSEDAGIERNSATCNLYIVSQFISS